MEKYELNCISNLGQLYRLVNSDSAMVYLTETLEKSFALGDTITYYSAHESLAGLYNYLADYTKSKRHAMKVINEGMTPYFYSCYYYAAQACLFLGNVDSAKQLFSAAPAPARLRDSILFFRTTSLLDNSLGMLSQAAIASDMASELSEKEILNSARKNLSLQENIESGELKRGKYEVRANLNFTMFVVSAVVLIVLLVLAFIYRRKIQRLVIELKSERIRTNELRQAQLQMRDDLKKQSVVISNMLNSEKDANNHEFLLAKLYKENVNAVFQATVLVGKHKKSLFSYIKLNQPEIRLDKNQWDQIIQYLYSAYPKAMREISTMKAPLTENELKLLALDCLGIPNVVIAKLLHYTDRSTITTRSRIAGELKMKGKSLQQGMELFENSL